MSLLRAPGGGTASGAQGPVGPQGPAGPTGALSVYVVTANTTVSDSRTVVANSASGALTITLAAPAANQRVEVKRLGANTVTVDPGAKTIDSASGTMQILQTGEAYTFASEGTNWYII